MRMHRVRALLMGGQVCVSYGAAEFSRDIDFVIVADAGNLGRLRKALAELHAQPIAVPPFELKYLRRGHAVNFRCQHPEALRMRVDIMSKLRGVAAFPELWKRRTTIELPDGTRCDLMSISNLVQAKKTQRDKDWPMIRRLVEAHYFENLRRANPAQIRFWFLQLRTANLLVQLAQKCPAACRRLVAKRPLRAHAALGEMEKIERELTAEESSEREQDRLHWQPLRAELEKLRRPK
jgi:hypothetical protein